MFRIISKNSSKGCRCSVLNNFDIEIEIYMSSFLSDSKKEKCGENYKTLEENKPKKEKKPKEDKKPNYSEGRVKKILDDFLYKKKTSST